jgi:glycosyltransferase involved in cell wall biosynthesis
VYHGLPLDLYACGEAPGGYLAYVGRISPEKGVDCAIEVARQSGIELLIAAKVDKADQRYFEDRIRPLLVEPGVQFIGEIGEAEKQKFLGNAIALMFQIDWPEPFGLVMIESMACGTPVIAFPEGSAPEVVDDGVTGFVVDDEHAMARAVGRLDEIDPAACREVCERRFSVPAVVRGYEAVYRAACARPAGLGLTSS